MQTDRRQTVKTAVVPSNAHVGFPLDFWLMYFNVRHTETFKPDGNVNTSIEVELGLHMEGKEISGVRRVLFSEATKLSPSMENAGPFDLMEGLCRELIIQRWPEFKTIFNNVAIGDLCLHVMHKGSDKYIAAVWQILLQSAPDSKVKNFAVQCESQSTIRAVVVALVKAYEVILKRYFKQKDALARDAAHRQATPPRPRHKRKKK